MEIQPKAVYGEYKEGVIFKNNFGKRGMYEQNKINTRFYNGDHWHGVSLTADRPLVCHNLIKRIGNYKNAKLSAENIKVKFGVKGEEKEDTVLLENLLNGYFETTAERLNLKKQIEDILRLSFISGTGVLYTYWDSAEKTGFFADEKKTTPVMGDILVEALNIENVYFGDIHISDVQKQPYIIIAAEKSNLEIMRTAKAFSGSRELLRLPEKGKTLTLTKLFKNKKTGFIEAVCVTENYTVRPHFCLNLKRYPLAVFTRDGGSFAYGESEVTSLIANQVAINRMLTASVWATMSMGMPIMAVNGDTVGEEITNSPGQIIRIYGDNEDVANAVRFITPPDFSENFKQSIEMLTNCTLASASVSSAALGEYNYSNAAAITALKSSVDESLSSLRNRFLIFYSDIALMFADFWFNKYGNRTIKTNDGQYSFSAEKYAVPGLTAVSYTEVQNEVL